VASHRRTLAAAAATILASVSLYPLFSGTAWFFGGIGAVMVVAAVGTLTRRRRLPVAACLGAGAAGLLLYLNLVFSNRHSLLHLLPTGSSLGDLWDLAGRGFTQSAKYAPPAPELSGMLLLAVGGIGITALLTDLIAVRLESAALAGLPLLLLFTVPFTLSVSRDIVGTTFAFCLGVVGYLGMLSSEGKDRIREWEYTNPDPRQAPDTRELAAAGRRVGTASVVLALCLPVVIPGLHATRLFGSGQPGIGGHGGGGGEVGFPTPDAQLSTELATSQPVTVFHYSSSSSAPDYFQTYVADNLSDSGWIPFSQPESVERVDPQLPLPPGLTNSNYTWATEVTTAVTMSKSVGPSYLGALPVGYPATKVVVHAQGGNVQAERRTLMVFDNGTRLAGLSYSVTSLLVSPSAQVLNAAAPPPADIANAYGQVPSSFYPLRNLAGSVVAAAGARTPFEKAVALQRWLTGPAFRYSLTAPAVKDANTLADFLEHTRRGDCLQFSFAMAVLARLDGIPSRVAYGYTAGTQTSNSNWLVTSHDAHAWPELYFQGFGWLRFEPTPAGAAPGQGTANAPPYTFGAGDGAPGSSAQRPAGATPAATGAAGNGAASRGLNGLRLPQNAGGGAVTVPSRGLNPWEVAGLCVLGLLVIAAAAPPAARLLIRRWRWRARPDAARAHAAWRELRDDLVDYRVGYLPSESPRTVATRAAASLELAEPAAAALRRIAMAEERARYAVRADSGTGLRRDSAVVRRAVAAAVPRRTRWRARLMPSSVLSPALAAIGQASDIFGRLNIEWPGRTRGFRQPRQARSGNLLQIPFLPPAPALVQALHHPAVAWCLAALLLALAALGRRPAPGHAKRDSGHVPPAVQRQDAAHQHDDEPTDGKPDNRQDNTRRDHPRAGSETEGRLHYPAPVVHAGIAGTHQTAQPPVLPVERLLDLLELALLMLRERHDASHENPGGWGDFHLTYTPGSFPRIRGSPLPVEGAGRLPPSAGPARASGSPETRLAGRTASLPNLRAIRSTARSASRQPTGRSSKAICRAAPAAGCSPAARTPTSRSRARLSSPDPSYSATAVA
jgi:transglutaminase-like putative cysteine protease